MEGARFRTEQVPLKCCALSLSQMTKFMKEENQGDTLGCGEDVTRPLSRTLPSSSEPIRALPWLFFLYFIGRLIYSNVIGDPCSVYYLGDWTRILMPLPVLTIFGEIILLR